MLHYISAGDEKKPPVLLLPGLLGTAETEMERFIQPIADMGYHVIAANFPGHGQSEMTKSLTMRVMVEEVERLLDGIHAEPVVIFGYSLGGYIGLSYAIKHPNRVVGLWMHATKFYWSGEEAESLAAELDLEYLTENKAERLENLKALHGEEKLEAMLPWLNKMMISLPDTGLTEIELEDIALPMVVSVGDHDELVPVNEALDLQRAIHRGQLCVFPDTNHPLPSLRDHVFLPIFKDFLNRLD